jgi:eukaryotic-like serine/threonine-protein kinase
MEYVPGESLSRLVRKTRDAGERIPPRHAIAIMCGALEGLHAAHEAKSERGVPLGMVHRDVSPQNVHVGVDGVSRVLDFGIAKATNRVQETRTDQIKGKVAYMSPEQLAKGAIDRRADVYSAAVVLWEALTGQRLFKADDVPSLVYSIINDEVEKPSAIVPDLPAGLDAIIMRGLDRDSEKRWSSAQEMAEALEKACPPSPPREIVPWVEKIAGEALAWRLDLVHRIESETTPSIPPPLRSESPSAPVEVSSGVSGVVNHSEHDMMLAATASVGHEQRVGAESVPDVLAPAPAEEHHPRSKLHLVAMAIAAVLLLAGAGLFVFRYLQLQGEPSVGGTEPTAPRASDSAEPAIAIAPIKPVGSASAKPTTTPPTPPQPPPVTAQPPTPPATTTKKHDCEDPFTVDSKGIRHPKPNCFKR